MWHTALHIGRNELAKAALHISAVIFIFCGIRIFLGVRIVRKVIHIKILAISPAAAEAHTVGLVKLAVVITVVTLQERILNPLNCKIKSPILAVDCDICKAAKRSTDAKFIHHSVCQIVLHIGVILNDIVQAQFIQTVVAFIVVVLVKFNLEAVTLAVH